MPSWPQERQIIGTKVERLNGPLKVSGKAKYSFDRNLPGLLHAKMLRSPHAHAKIEEIDLGPAERMPGVKAVHLHKAKDGELFYAGDEIAAIAAETEEQARDAVRAVRVKYQILPHVGSEDQGLAQGGAALKKPSERTEGDPDAAFKDCAATIEGLYAAPVITHVCLETHGLVAHWVSEDELVVYASTQAVGATADALRGHFKDVPNVKVRCETPFMGGGFGAKFGPDVQGIIAAELARKAKRPVKLMLERDEEHVAGGNRPSAFAKIKAGADAAGNLVAFQAELWGSGGHSGGADFPCPYIYAAEELPPEVHRRPRELRRPPRDARPGTSPGLRRHGSGHG